MNPPKLECEIGNSLICKRISTQDPGYVAGPMNHKGKKIKIIDLTDPVNIPRHLPKVKLKKENKLADLKSEIR